MTTNKTIRAIDVWAQPADAQVFQHIPEIEPLFQHSGSAEILKTGITPEQTIELMDGAGVEKVLLSAWHRPGKWVVSNDAVAAIINRYPDRFAGIAAVNLEKPLEAVRELERAVKELGFIALRVVPWLWNRPPNDKFYFPLYVKCIELDIPFCTQVGHTGPLMPSEPGRPVPYLDEVALIFPELKIVAGHIGFPWTDEMIGLAWKHANVFIDTSAHLPRYYPPQLLHYLKSYGKKKVLFGTNFPQLPFEKCVSQACALDLPEDVLANFLCENARRVFKLA
jgi:predicted TIM-barrel fold metal-dependent hydrolase